eukprot:scaffold54568_cov59-Phaeocystis_antarctica.AAC.4
MAGSTGKRVVPRLEHDWQHECRQGQRFLRRHLDCGLRLCARVELHLPKAISVQKLESLGGVPASAQHGTQLGFRLLCRAVGNHEVREMRRARRNVGRRSNDRRAHWRRVQVTHPRKAGTVLRLLHVCSRHLRQAREVPKDPADVLAGWRAEEPEDGGERLAIWIRVGTRAPRKGQHANFARAVRQDGCRLFRSKKDGWLLLLQRLSPCDMLEGASAQCIGIKQPHGAIGERNAQRLVKADEEQVRAGEMHTLTTRVVDERDVAREAAAPLINVYRTIAVLVQKLEDSLNLLRPMTGGGEVACELLRLDRTRAILVNQVEELLRVTANCEECGEPCPPLFTVDVTAAVRVEELEEHIHLCLIDPGADEMLAQLILVNAAGPVSIDRVKEAGRVLRGQAVDDLLLAGLAKLLRAHLHILAVGGHPPIVIVLRLRARLQCGHPGILRGQRLRLALDPGPNSKGFESPIGARGGAMGHRAAIRRRAAAALLPTRG